MKLLWIVPYAPNPIRVRSYQFLRTLAARGHEITLAALWSSKSEYNDLNALTDWGIEIWIAELTRRRSLLNAALALPTRTPLQARFANVPALHADVVEALQQTSPDAIHVEHLRGAPYAEVALRARRPRADGLYPPIVWDSVDCISHLFAQAAAQSASARGRWMARLELSRTRRAEALLPNLFDQTVVTAASDAAALRSLAGANAPISVVPNGVDLAGFSPPATPAQRAPARIIFTGKMSYHANVSAAVHLVQTIMPLVWAQRADAEVWLVGKEPAPEVRALASTRVIVTGGVDSMAAALQAATVAAAPITYGAGIQNKVLEAMACATPVVASPQAVSALEAVAGRDYLPGATPAEFAASVLALLDNPHLRAQVGEAGRAYVEDHHTWGAAAERLEALYLAPARTERGQLARRST
jgi:glycosyltransferase involved in cell wall biosynthesis